MEVDLWDVLWLKLERASIQKVGGIEDWRSKVLTASNRWQQFLFFRHLYFVARPRCRDKSFETRFLFILVKLLESIWDIFPRARADNLKTLGELVFNKGWEFFKCIIYCGLYLQEIYPCVWAMIISKSDSIYNEQVNWWVQYPKHQYEWGSKK